MSERAAVTAKKTESKGKDRRSARQKADSANSFQSMDTPVEQVLHLQRTIGNRAVTGLLQSGALQAKLRIGQPGDIYEREADSVADRVMKMPDSAVRRQTDDEEKEELQGKPIAEQITPLVQKQPEEEEPLQTETIQRQETEEEEEPLQTETIQRQETEEEEEPVQAKPLQRQENEEEEPIRAKGSAGGSQTVSPSVESGINSMKGGGSPLPESTRDYFEPRFGADFSPVRVHTGPRAAQTAQSINARAYTTGREIVFNTGQYSPGTATGQRLMAHELTHTLQQGAAVRKKQPDISISTTSPKIQGGLFSKGLDWALEKLKPHFSKIPGYDLIKVIIGKDPVTGKKVPRTPENFIKGLLGQDRYARLNKSGAISDAFEWLNTRVKELNISFSLIWGLVKEAGNYFIKNPWKIFSPFSVLKEFFGPPISRILTFIKAIGGKILEFIFKGVLRLAGAPVDTIMKILNKGAAIIGKIIKDPIGFARNLLKAVKMGFNLFTTNFVKHLKASIANWLFGTLSKAGIELPKKFDLKGIFYLSAQILGITYQNIRAKIVKKLGPKGEQMVSRIEKTVTFVKEFITKGPIVLWEKAKAFLGNLKETIFGAIIGWVRNTIIRKAVIKIISMLNPVGALYQAAMAIYNTVMFFHNRWNQIKSLVQAIFNSIAPIVNGQVGGAAKWIEQVMARGLTVIISFLARLVGLGGISQKIRGVIAKIRKPIDNAMDKIITWIVEKGKALFGKGKALIKKGKEKLIGWWKKRKTIRTKSGVVHDLYFSLKGKSNPVPMVASEPMTVAEQLARWEKRTTPSKEAANLLRQAKDLNDQLDAQQMSPGSTKKGSSNVPGAPDKKIASEIDEKLGNLAAVMSKLYDIFEKGTEYPVGEYPQPKDKKDYQGEGRASHHVPQKVFKKWIGEMYETIGDETGNTGLRDEGKKYQADKKGNGLSAILLPGDVHAEAHNPKLFPKGLPGNLKFLKKSGDETALYYRSTITKAIHESYVKGSKTEDIKEMKKEIYEKTGAGKKTKDMIDDTFKDILGKGIEFVKKAMTNKGKPASNTNWVAELKTLARNTWGKLWS